MKKILIFLAIIFIVFPQIIKEDDFIWPKILKRAEEFFDSDIKATRTSKLVDTDLVSEELSKEELKSEIEERDKNILISVPFISQAPLGDWSDARQQDACEEAGTIMAMAWINGREEISAVVAKQEIIALADWQEEKYGEHRDLYIDEVRERLFSEYFKYEKVETKEIVDKVELVEALKDGKIILAPTNGQALKNPHFTPPGPERHLLVIIGYDVKADEFITNDPGTRYGASYRYKTDLLFDAIRAYPSGYHNEIKGIKKVVLFVSR